MANVADGATGTILTAPSPATSGTSVVLNAGEGYRFPAVPFFAVAHPNNTIPTVSTAEKVQVTAQGQTTIAVGSNGASLPQATINVVDTTSLLSAGTVTIMTAAGAQVVTYTGKTGTTLTGASGGTGVMSTGGVVMGDNFTIVRAISPYVAQSIATTWRFSNAIFASDLNNASIVRNEVPVGSVNGSNTLFTTASQFQTNSLSVFKNGIRLKGGGADYTATAGGFTMFTAPATGTVLLCEYFVGGTINNIGTNSIITDETPTGSVNGSNTAYTSARPYIAGSLEIYINGLKQIRGTDYTETTPSTSAFTMTVAPITGDSVRINYQFNLNPASNADTTDGYHASISPSLNTIPVTDNDNVLLANPYQNYVINGGCQIAQRVTAPSLSTTSQYGKVDRFRVHATGTAVSAGTITQGTAQTFAKTGNTLQVSGATITGTGVVLLRHRIEAKNAIQLKNLVASFVATVYHDVGSTINYTITIRKPTASDNFASTTDIQASSALPVATATATKIRLENVSLGDVTNGIEIEISVACGAVTTKNFHFTDFVFNYGAVAMGYAPQTFDRDLYACMRYYEKSYDYTEAPGASTTSQALIHNSFNSGNTMSNSAVFKVTKRTAPTVTVYDRVGNINKISYVAGTASATDNTAEPSKTIKDTGWCYSAGGMPTSSQGSSFLNWIADAEL